MFIIFSSDETMIRRLNGTHIEHINVRLRHGTHSGKDNEQKEESFSHGKEFSVRGFGVELTLIKIQDISDESEWSETFVIEIFLFRKMMWLCVKSGKPVLARSQG